MNVSVLRCVIVITLGALLGCSKGTDAMQVEDINPRVGHTLGGQTVRVLGKNFRPNLGYTVYFGSKKAGTVSIMNNETLMVTTPNHDRPEQVDILVRADDGQAFRIKKGFRFEDMRGNVMEQLGSPKKPKGDSKLAY